MATSAGGRYSAAWEQFLVGRRLMLAEYDQAKEHSRHLSVQAHHGHVAEAAFRAWLESFLPKRYGVTSGYIRGQQLRTPWDYAHFDVIIFDQLNSPILWVETSKDKSDAGRSRIIPAEHVRAVLEVKSAFNMATVTAAAEKLQQLQPLMEKTDPPDERYPSYLPSNTFLGMVYFELRSDASLDIRPLTPLRDLVMLPRQFYGAIVLRAEALHADDTGLVQLFVAKEPVLTDDLPGGLVGVLPHSPYRLIDGSYYQAVMSWADIHFSQFAFDLLAFMNGTYRAGFTSSFHSIDFGKFPAPPAKDGG